MYRSNLKYTDAILRYDGTIMHVILMTSNYRIYQDPTISLSVAAYYINKVIEYRYKLTNKRPS